MWFGRRSRHELMVGLDDLSDLFNLNHRMAWIGGDLKISSSFNPPPCHWQGCQPLDQAAQDLIQPGLECLQEHNAFMTL